MDLLANVQPVPRLGVVSIAETDTERLSRGDNAELNADPPTGGAEIKALLRFEKFFCAMNSLRERCREIAKEARCK